MKPSHPAAQVFARRVLRTASKDGPRNLAKAYLDARKTQRRQLVRLLARIDDAIAELDHQEPQQ